MATVEDARRELARHIGYRELGTNLTPFNREFGRLPGYPHDGYGYPWCHSFISVCLKRAGLRPDEDFPWTASCTAGVAWFKQRKRWGSTPRPGALVYYGPGGGTHVEWVEKVTTSSIVTIGGNTSGVLEGRYYNGDGVYRKTISRSNPRIYGYGYPAYGEDDMRPDEVFAAVWQRDKIPSPDDYEKKKTNPTWTAQTMLQDTNAKVRAMHKNLNRLAATVREQGATIKELTALVRQLQEQIRGFETS